MKVTFPTTQPLWFHAESFLTALNYSDLQNPSLRGRTYIGKDAVLFKFSKFPDPVRIYLELRKTGGIETLDYAESDVPANSGDQFILFEDFPASYTRNNTHCQYEIWLINLRPNQTDQSTSVKVEVLYRV